MFEYSSQTTVGRRGYCMCKRWIWYAKIGVGGSHMEHGDRLCVCLGHGGGELMGMGIYVHLTICT
jgi:hypothetical protein